MPRILTPESVQSKRDSARTAKISSLKEGRFYVSDAAAAKMGVGPLDRIQFIEGDEPGELFVYPVDKCEEGFELLSNPRQPLRFWSAALRRQLLAISYPRHGYTEDRLVFILGVERTYQVDKNKKPVQVWPLYGRAII